MCTKNVISKWLTIMDLWVGYRLTYIMAQNTLMPIQEKKKEKTYVSYNASLIVFGGMTSSPTVSCEITTIFSSFIPLWFTINYYLFFSATSFAVSPNTALPLTPTLFPSNSTIMVHYSQLHNFSRYPLCHKRICQQQHFFVSRSKKVKGIIGNPSMIKYSNWMVIFFDNKFNMDIWQNDPQN